VQVEVRGGAGGAFGLGRKAHMPFREFVRRAAGGDAGLYLSAQPVRGLRGGRRGWGVGPALRLRQTSGKAA
jgi:hypothetical protein